MSGLLAVTCAVYLGALDRIAEGASGWRKLWKALGVVLLIAGAAELIGVAAGSADLLQPLRGIMASAAGIETRIRRTRMHCHGAKSNPSPTWTVN